jgi:toxin FitB
LADRTGPVVLDTDIASLIIKNAVHPPPTLLVGRTWCVSFVTVGELVKWAESHNWGLRKWTELAEWLGRVVVLPYDVRVAYAWGQLAAAAGRGR